MNFVGPRFAPLKTGNSVFEKKMTFFIEINVLCNFYNNKAWTAHEIKDKYLTYKSQLVSSHSKEM